MSPRFTQFKELRTVDVFDAVTLAADRTTTFSAEGFNMMTCWCTYTHHSDVTGLTLEVAGRPSHDSNYFKYLEENQAANEIDLNVLNGRQYDLLHTALVSTSVYRFAVVVPVGGDSMVQLTLNGTGTNAAALMTMSVTLTNQ